MTVPELKSVTVQSIHDELRALWAAEALTGDAVIRARTHNLIVAVTDDVSPSETTQRVIESTAERPGRVIVLDIEIGRAKPLDAWVTAYCRTVNRHQLCGEVITLTVSAERLGELYSTVASLLAPDLPVYVWWSGPVDLNNRLLNDLARDADRLIINLEHCPDLLKTIARLTTVSSEYNLGDMAWVRLATWRKLLAQVWDLAEARHALKSIRTLDVHYVGGNKDACEARSILLTGWLIKKLSWHIESVHRGPTGGLTINYSHRNWHGKVEIIRTSSDSAEAGEIERIFIQAGDKPPFVMPRIELNASRNTIETRWNEGSSNDKRTVNTIHNSDDASVLVEALDEGYDPDYLLALKGAASIFENVNNS